MPLVQTNDDITLDTGSQVHLSLEVELDAQEEGGIAERAIILGGTLDELTWRIEVSIHFFLSDILSEKGWLMKLTSRLSEAGGGGERDGELLRHFGGLVKRKRLRGL
jgi:hypothetical protein